MALDIMGPESNIANLVIIQPSTDVNEVNSKFEENQVCCLTICIAVFGFLKETTGLTCYEAPGQTLAACSSVLKPRLLIAIVDI